MKAQQMRAHTQSMTLGARWEPSPVAQATRSLRLANRLREEGRQEDYREAITQHFALFSPRPPACPLG